MKDSIYDIYASEFQLAVEEQCKRNRGLFDALTKHGCASSRLARAVTKSVTQCRCTGIAGDGTSTGELCPDCRETIEDEIGEELFFLAVIANNLGLSLYDILIKERNKMGILGKYSLK